MNLNDFSLLKEDETNYVIGHPKGKSITVPKKGISDKAQKLISGLKRQEGLYKGGEAENPNYEDEEFANAVLNANIAPSEPLESLPVNLGSDQGLEDLNQTMGYEAQEIPNASIPEPAAAPASVPNVQMPAQPQSEKVPDLIEDPTGKARTLLDQGVKAEVKAAETSNQAYEDAAKLVKASQDAYDLRVKDYNTRDANLYKAAVENKIDPDRYWNSLDTGSRIAASIGMVLSGMGSAVTGQPNYALENIKRAINQDIEGQKNSQSNAMNLWKMNRQLMGADQKATLATQNQYLSLAKAKVNQAQALAAGPKAAAGAVKLGLELDNQINENNKAQALMDMANQPVRQGRVSNMDPAKLVYTQVPKHLQKEAIAAIDAAKNRKKFKDEIIAAYDQAVKERFSPLENGGKAKLKTLLPATLSQIEGTVRVAAKEALEEASFPSKFESANSVAERRKGLIQYLDSNAASSVLSAAGIDLNNFESTRPKAYFQKGDILERKQ
jgi:hypothetical protein